MQHGELYRLGNHLLYCGDCREPNSLTAMNIYPVLGLHDPPYGLRSKMWWGFGDGKQYGYAKRGVFDPVYNDDTPFDPHHLLESASVVVIWGANHFADKLPASSAWIIWDKREGMPSNDQSDGEVAWVSKGNTTRIIHHRWNGCIKASERGIARIHPTQKPVHVMKIIIEQYTSPGDIVCDWYAGSGTTLIACERTNRSCHAIEIMPKYCEKIIARWEEETGQKAVQVANSPILSATVIDSAL